MNFRPETPGPLNRRGPRPLLLHLTLAWMRSSGLAGGSANWNSVWPNLIDPIIARHANPNPGPQNAPGDEPKPQPRTPPGTATPEPRFDELATADRQLIRGIAAYRQSPYARQLRDPPAVWEEGESRLLNYSRGGAGEDGPAVLFVPSLINRAYILDLMPDDQAQGGSMLRWLAGQGARPYLLDWGWPGPVERQFSLTDYIAGRLERAVATLENLSGGPVVLAGYCMGGLLALAAALRCPTRVKALALLATPWDFHNTDEAAAKRLSDTVALLEPMLLMSGTLPIDVLQTLFTMIDPFGVGDKYRGFASLDPATTRARRFVAMEDWLADGVPLAAPVAREALTHWYGANAPARGAWRVAGLAVDPARLDMPSFCAIPERDRLVPPESARPLAALLKDAHVVEPAAGHIGMVAGANAQSALWQPFADWLRALR